MLGRSLQSLYMYDEKRGKNLGQTSVVRCPETMFDGNANGGMEK